MRVSDGVARVDDDDDGDDDDDDELVVKAQRKRLMREIMREQRELIERESSRADDAEEELLRVTAQADALSLKLDAIEESYVRRASASAEATTTATETTATLTKENERLRLRVKELEDQVAQLRNDMLTTAAVAAASPAKSASTSSPPFGADERRKLLRELADAKKDVALAKEARAKALAETIELRSKLENASNTPTRPTRTSVALASIKSPPKTPEWVNVEWDASYGADSKDNNPPISAPMAAAPATAPQLPTEKIDWDAAYAEIDAIRSSKKW